MELQAEEEAEDVKEAEQVFRSIQSHDVSKLRKAIEDGFNVEELYTIKSLNVYFSNALVHAVKSNFREGVEILLRETDMDTQFGFIEARNSENDDLTRLFLQVACERRRCSSEYLLLLLRQKRIEMAVEYVKMDGYDVDDQSLFVSGMNLRSTFGREGQSPLHVSAAFQKAQLLEHLIASGGRLDIKDDGDFTPLYVACIKGNFECCHCLLKHGANPSLIDSTKPDSCDGPRSPLYALCRLSQPPINENIVKLLLSAGIDTHKEKWLLDKGLQLSISDDTFRLLRSSCVVPATLNSTCIREIRQHLSKLSSGRSILSKVQDLPVPPFFRERLSLCHFEQAV